MNKGGTVKSGQMSFHPFDLEDESCGVERHFLLEKITNRREVGEWL